MMKAALEAWTAILYAWIKLFVDHSGQRNVCPALKTHLANKLGRKMGKNKLWKSGDGFHYYKGFLKK